MNIKRVMLGLALAACVATPSFATPIKFTINKTSFTPGTGYGTGSENLLDVVFTGTNGANNMILDVNDSQDFTIGTVNLRETCINNPGSSCPGTGNEANGDLSVGVTLHFLNPLSGNTDVSLTGKAVQGDVADSQKDYWLTFATQEFTFGNGGKFSLGIKELDFFSTGTQTLTGTLTLLAAPQSGEANSVPEPTSIALMGLGLVGLGYGAKRRKS